VCSGCIVICAPSVATCQAAQLRRSSGSGVLSTMTQGNITASAAQQLMAAVSDSGSAPSAASEASDAETRPVNRPALPDKGVGSIDQLCLTKVWDQSTSFA
jgi:hypothetical protein